MVLALYQDTLKARRNKRGDYCCHTLPRPPKWQTSTEHELPNFHLRPKASPQLHSGAGKREGKEDTRPVLITYRSCVKHHPSTTQPLVSAHRFVLAHGNVVQEGRLPKTPTWRWHSTSGQGGHNQDVLHTPTSQPAAAGLFCRKGNYGKELG